MLLAVLLASELCTCANLSMLCVSDMCILPKANYVSIKNNFKQIYSQNTYIQKTPKVCDAGNLPNFFIYVRVSLIVTEKMNLRCRGCENLNLLVM